LRQLRQLAPVYGFDNIVYLDESGFEASSCRQRAWGRIGKRVYGDRSGNKRPRTSLIAAKRGRKMIAPVLFSGCTDADWFNQWLKEHLFSVLAKPSVIILDNAAFHKTGLTLQIVADSPHVLLFLPPYSPDFNPIERDFATLKKRRQFAPSGTPLDTILNEYVCYLE
jgi:transposase